jgi:hypothetical protein
MAGVNVDSRTILMVVLVVGILIGGLYLLNPSYMTRMFGGREGFQDASSDKVLSEKANFKRAEAASDAAGSEQMAANVGNPNVAMAPGSDTSTALNENAPEMILPPSVSGFADLSDYEGPSQFGNAQPPAGCYPRDQLTPSELLPKDPNSVWAQQNPMGTGSLKGKNFLSAGALIGVNTVGQSLRNANYQLRSEPPNPQVPVSVFNQTTIEPDVNRRTMEIA